MGQNSDVFLRMSEEHYMQIPNEIREMFLSAKRVDEEKSDWQENMKDETYSVLYKSYKTIKKQLSEREYQLRENRRNENLKNK